MEPVGTFFAIREKGTRKYLPEVYGRGYTHAEPCAGPQPRLFSTEHAAKIALTCWLKGRADTRTSTDWETGRTEDTGVDYLPVAGRSRDKMEIVELSLLQIGLNDGRPFSADEAILKALKIEDFYDREEFLRSWSEGAWDECLQMIGEAS